MGDTEMLDQEAPSGSDAGPVDAGIQQKETSETEKATNQNENVQSPCSRDKSLALTTDVRLPDVADDEMGDDAKAGNVTGANANDDDGTANIENVISESDAKPRDETNSDARPRDETKSDAKPGDGSGADAMAAEECNVVAEAGDGASVAAKAGDEGSVGAKAGDEASAGAKAGDESDANVKAARETGADRNADNETGDVGTDGSTGKSIGKLCLVDNQLRASSPPGHGEYSTPQVRAENGPKWKTWLLTDDELQIGEADEAGTPEEQAEFIKDVEIFHKEHFLEFKAPKFYGQPLNCLKLWRAVIKLGGYDVVTASKLWRQVGESFHPPKTCTTVSWTFRIFYEKALLEYEKYLRQTGELHLPGSPFPQFSSVEKEANSHPGSGSGRARRDAAARAMQGWHAQRLLGSGDVTEPIVKDKSFNSASRREKNLKSIGLQKQRTQASSELLEKPLQSVADKQVAAEVIDIGPPADWVKINVRESKDCFEIYALVPGLLREEVRVQSDPAGRLVITGQPEQLDNPWGITPFKKVVNLPVRIDPLQTSAVVSLHGRLFVRVPFEQ